MAKVKIFRCDSSQQLKDQLEFWFLQNTDIKVTGLTNVDNSTLHVIVITYESVSEDKL